MVFSIEVILLIISLLIFISIVASKASDRLGLPTLLIFIAIGMLAGSEGLGGIYFDQPWLAKFIGVTALVYILFGGGFDTQWHSIKNMLMPGAALATMGVLLTAGLIGLASVYFLHFTPWEGFLLGSIISSTDMAAVLSILRAKHVSVQPKIRSLLELESGSNDPMAVFLTVGILHYMQTQHMTLYHWVGTFCLEMGLGLVLGLALGKAMTFIINRINLQYEGLYPVLTFTLVPLVYAVTTLLHGNGFLAVYVAGIVLGNSDLMHKKPLLRFHDGITWLVQIVMFVVLGLLVFPSRLVPVLHYGLLLSAILIFAARPISVFLCLWPFKMKLNEKLMVSWVGLRGAAPIILATFPLIAGIEKADMIFNLVFFVVLTSALLQGFSIPWVSKRLGLEVPLAEKKHHPLEWDHLNGIDAELIDIIVPYQSSVVGKKIFEIGVPKEALIVLISRKDTYLIPGGATLLEGGDVLLILANKSDAGKLQAMVM